MKARIRGVMALWVRYLVAAMWMLGSAAPLAHAAPADGINWLASIQNADGSFANTPTSLATPVQSTAEVLGAYQTLKLSAQPGFTAALTYLNTDAEDNTEYLARKIVVNSRMGNNVTAWVNELVTRQNTDGGFGGAPGYASSVLDTAFALEALAVAHPPAGTTLNASVGFLLTKQQASGGWNEGNNTASVYLTALSLRSLWYFRHDYTNVPPALDKARDYLLATRDAAGLWEETFTTALVLNALIPYLPDATSVSTSLGSVRSSQFANGSWNDDPYTTALALRALSLADQPQTNPDFVTLQGKVVDTQTGLPLSGVSVALTGASSAMIQTAGDGVFLFRNLPAGSYALQLTLASYGVLSTATAGQNGQTLDLGTLGLTKFQGATTGTIKGVVTDAATGLPLAGVTVSATGVAVPAQTDASGVYQLSNVPPGPITLSASKSGYGTVTGSASLAGGGVLVFSPSLNTGNAQATVIQGDVRDGVTGLSLAGVSINITGAATASALTDAQGHYQITGLKPGVVAISASLPGYDSVTTGAAIAEFSTVDFSPLLYLVSTTPPNSNTAGITGIVLDAGSNLPLPGATIAATFGATSKTLTSDTAGRFMLNGLTAADGTLHVVLAGYVTADLSIALAPLKTLDIGQIRLRKDKVTALQPDLIISTVTRTTAPTDAQSLIISGTITADIANIGTANAPANIQLTAFYDTNRNGLFDQDDIALGQTVTSADLPVGMTTPVSIPVHGSLPFRDAPIFVWVDSSQTVAELKENNNITSTSSICEIKPDIGTFKPVLKWTWTKGAVITTPIVGPLQDTNGDGKIDQQDMPAIIFTTHTTFPDGQPGILRAVSGKDGHDLWSVTDPSLAVGAEAAPALADIDGDGKPEIVAYLAAGGMAAFNGDGTLKWRSSYPPLPGFYNYGAPTVADLDGDGLAEIVARNYVLNSDGTLRFQFNPTFNSYLGHSVVTVVADLDLDGSPEVTTGSTAVHADGSLYWRNPSVPDGRLAVADFDGDSYPEIVVVAGARAYMLNHDGTIKWGPVTLSGAYNGGAPTIADMDGDGVPDIGIAGAAYYTVLNSDGSVKWQSKVHDGSGATGSSVFDFDGDGQAEVVYADEQYLRVYRGSTGEVLFSIPNYSVTALEYPAIVDIDNDGHADIVVPSQGAGGGIRVFQDINNSWVNTRKIWNQYNYHITNINDDGSVPRVEQNSWQTHNTYRLNAFPDRSATGVPDLTAALLRVVDNGTGQPLSLTLRVGNAGAVPVAAGVSTGFYQGDPAAGGTLLGTVSLQAIGIGTYQDIRLDNVVLSGVADIYAVADSGNNVSECNETNNTATVPVSAAQLLGAITVATDQPVYAPNSLALITTTVTNTGALPADYSVALQIEDAQGGVVTTQPAQTVGPLNGGANASVAFSWNVGTTLSGSYTVRVILRAANGDILNEAITGVSLRHPDTAGPVVSLRVSTDRPVYYTYDLVNIDSLVGNLSLSTLIDQASLRLTIIDVSGQTVFTTRSAIGQLLPNSLRALSLPYTLNDAAIATYQLRGEVLDARQMVLASSQVSFEVRFDLSKALTGKVEASLSSLEAGTTQTCTAILSNKGTVAVTGLEVHHALINMDLGQMDNELLQTVNLEPGELTTYGYSFGAQGLASGNYACALQARINGDIKTLAFTPFRVTQPPIKLDATLKPGAQGRLLVLLDNTRHPAEGDDDHQASCDGVKRLVLTATLPATLSPSAVVEARVYRNNNLVDSESANLASFTGPVNVSAGSRDGDLTLSALSDHSLTLTLVPAVGETRLSSEYTVEAIITDGSTLTLRTDTLSTGCDHPLAVGQVHQAFTVSALDRLPAANDGKVSDADPHGPKTAPGLAAQRAFLEQLLKTAGRSYTITDTAEDFTRAFHSGGYTTYALLAEDEKLSEQTQQELREAVYRGEGLVVAGAHDSENLHEDRLRDALGLKLIGNVSNANGVDLQPSPLALLGHINLIPDDRAMRIQRTTATVAGVYTVSAAKGHDTDDCRDDDDHDKDNETKDKNHDACEGHPESYLDAVTLNAYGKGRADFAGVDLLATATRDGQTSLAAETLRKLLGYGVPSTLATGPGAVVPLELTLKNQGVAVSVTVSLPLPTGMRVMDPGNATVSGQTLTWILSLAVNEEKTLRLWVRLPDQEGPVALTGSVVASAGGATVSYAPLLTLAVVQPPALVSVNTQLDVLIQGNPPDKQALKKARESLDKALKNMTPAPAIKEVLKATDALLGLTDPAVVAIRTGLDTWLHWAAQYAY